VALAGCAVALLVLCFAEAATYFDQPGGAYLYTRAAFGDFVGFQVGWMTWLARVASVASLSAGLALATSYLWPAAAEGWARAVVITAPLAALTWINVVGVKPGARAAVTFAVAKTLPLVLFVGAGLFAIESSRLAGAQWPETGVLGEATLLLLFAYAGFENTPAAAGEYKNPQRDVPFALLGMILLVTVIYTGVQVVALGTLPGLAQSAAPLADAAEIFLGGWAGTLMAVAGVVSIAGNVGNTTLVGPRYLFALARDGYGPSVLAGIHPRYHTPVVAILTQSIVAGALALSGSFVELAMLSIVARLATYIGTAASIPILRRRLPRLRDGFVIPGGPVVPIAALALCLVFLASATLRNAVAGVLALLIGAVLYRLRRPDPAA
jgi:APA family basic amino acid/polyamine antiporter